MNGRAWAVFWDRAPSDEVARRSDEDAPNLVEAKAAAIRAAAACAGDGGALEIVLLQIGGSGAGSHTLGSLGVESRRDIESVPAWLSEAAGGIAISRVWLVAHALLDRGTPGATATALAAAAAAVGDVRAMCLVHDYDAVDLCGLLEHALGGTAITSVVAVQREAGGVRVVRPVHGGRLHAELRVTGDRPLVLTVPRAFARSTSAGSAKGSGTGSPVERLVLDPALTCSLPDRELLGVDEPDTPASLVAAERIVAVGRGLGGPEHLPLARRLATALSAELAGSRPVIDAGWLPPERQVGSSGQTVAPALYLALGISGAAQHLEGISSARCVVAINRDPEAPLFRSARYGIVADLHALVPELIAALAEDDESRAT